MSFWKHIWPKKEEKPALSFESQRLSELDSKIESTSRVTMRITDDMRRTSNKFHRSRAVRERIARFAVRNKKRKILVIELEKNESELALSLLESNSRAEAVYAESLDHAYEIYDESISMVYLITKMGTGSKCEGPCFYSLNEPKDEPFRSQRQELTNRMKFYREKFNNSEVMVVCGTNVMTCPLAEGIYKQIGNSGIFSV